MKKIIPAGATDQTIDVFVQDSASTTGGGKTGLVYNSASLVCYYRKGATGTPTALTLATQTVGGAHSDGGFVELDATNMPGMYRLDLSDTIVASEGSVTLMLKGASGMAPVTIELQVVSATRGLTGTALPNAAADAAGGLPISDAGGLDLDARLDAAVSSRLAPTTAGRTLDVTATGEAGIDLANVGSPTATLNLSGTTIATSQVVASVSGAVGSVTGAVGSVTGNVGGNVAGSVGSVTAGVTLAASAVQAIWDALTSALTTVGSIGKLLVDRIDAAISSRSSHSATDVWAAGTRTLTAGTNISLAKGTGVTGFTDLDAAGVRTAVGLASANLDTQLADLPTVAEFEARTLASASYATASALTTIAGYLDTEIAAILADTNELQTDWANGGRLDLLLDAVKAITDAIGATAAAKLALTLGAASPTGTAATGTLSTTQMTTNLTEATDDHYNNRVVLWTSGALVGQARAVTDYNGTTKMLSFAAVTEAPSNGDAFILI